VLCVEAQRQNILNRCSWAQELINEHGADNVLYVNLCGSLPADTRSALNDNVVDCNMTDGYCHSLEELLLLSATVHQIRVRRTDLIEDSTVVEVRYEQRTSTGQEHGA
jgi:hypothetical protein